MISTNSLLLYEGYSNPSLTKFFMLLSLSLFIYTQIHIYAYVCVFLITFCAVLRAWYVKTMLFQPVS